MKKVILSITVAIGIIVILAGGIWLYKDKIQHTPIADILSNPRNYEGQLLTVEGQVTEVFSLLVVKYYKVKDKTGEISVVTNRFLPKAGSNVRVTGTIDSAFSIGTDQVIVLNEQESALK